MKDFKFELGIKVKDIITGFPGVIMGRADYLTGCNQYAVSPTDLNKEGKCRYWEWFDENRLKVVPGKKIEL